MALKSITKKHLEAELSSYHDIDEQIKQAEHSILYPPHVDELPPEAQKSFNTDAPFERTSNRVLCDKRIQRLTDLKRAIEKVYRESTDEDKKLIELKYFTRPQTLNSKGVALKLNLSQSQFYRQRDAVLERLADELGIVH